jgi:hypothetical protein
MRNGFAFWVICLSLVFTRLVGLHLHACAGVEAGVEHAGTHYADNGFLFGDHHSEDDGDDREVQFVAALSSLTKIAVSDLAAPLPAPPTVVATATVLLTVAAPRGPPLSIAAHPPHFTPPLRGPPASLA